jgi:hypothetical protein
VKPVVEIPTPWREENMMTELAQRKLLISKGWIQAVVIVMLCGFLILGMLAYRTYTDEPPIPSQVVDPNGQVLFTGADVLAGQEVFLRNGLMEYGSIFGHGAYLGPDFTADYLHRAALIVTEHYASSSPEAAKQQTIADFKTNRYDSVTGVLTYTAAQVEAFEKLDLYYGEFFGNPTTKYGLRPSAITEAPQIKQLTAFFSWSAWTASTFRPNLRYSYTLLDCSAGRYRPLACCFWPLEFPGLARSRGPARFVPSSRRGGSDARAAIVCLVFLSHGTPICFASASGRCHTALSC